MQFNCGNKLLIRLVVVLGLQAQHRCAVVQLPPFRSEVRSYMMRIIWRRTVLAPSILTELFWC